LPRGTKEAVDIPGNGGSIKAIDRRQGGQDGIGHALRHKHDPHGDTREEVRGGMEGVHLPIELGPGEVREGEEGQAFIGEFLCMWGREVGG
jgi:hypothetical protein